MDSDAYFCSAVNLLGTVEKKTFLVVVSLRFNIKPPVRAFRRFGGTLMLNCSAIGDLLVAVSWKKERGQLPVGRSQQDNGALVITDIRMEDEGKYTCSAKSARTLVVETGTYIKVLKGKIGLIPLLLI